MKKLAEEFNCASDVVRLGDADATRISYAVFCGDPNNDDEGFLGTGFFSADDFTTWNDAAKARLLVANILAIVDAHKDEDTGKETSRDLYFNRQKIFHTIEETVRDVLAIVPKDAPHLDCILIAELICSLNDVFDTTAD